MAIIDNNQRLTLLVENSPSTMLHLLVGNNDRGMMFFACEQAPLLAFKNHGLPARCPICSMKNPLSRALNDYFKKEQTRSRGLSG
jgi:hypothetical protein